MGDFIPLDCRALRFGDDVADGDVHLLQHIARADQYVLKTRHAGGIRHRIFVNLQTGKGRTIQVKGRALHKPVLAGLGDFQIAAFEGVVEMHGSSLPADDGNALRLLRLIAVNRLLGDGINARVEIGNVDFTRRIGGFCFVIALAGNGKGNALHFTVLRGFHQFHTAGLDLQIQIAGNRVGNRYAIGGVVLLAASDFSVRPDDYAASLPVDLLRFNGNRAFDGGIGGNRQLVAACRNIQPCGAAGKGEVGKDVVFVRQSYRIFFTVPFQFIGTGAGAAMGKEAGQHGMALHLIFNGIVLLKNQVIQGVIGADIVRNAVLSLRRSIHMVKLAVALTYDGFPHQKLCGDISRDVLRVGRVAAVPCGAGIALPAILHDPPKVFFDSGGRNSGVHIRGVIIPIAFIPPLILVAGMNADARLNTVNRAAIKGILRMDGKVVACVHRPAAHQVERRMSPTGFLRVCAAGKVDKIGGHFFTGGKGRDPHPGKYSKAHEQCKKHGKGLFQCFH